MVSYIKGGTHAKDVREQYPKLAFRSRRSKENFKMKNFVICTVHLI